MHADLLLSTQTICNISLISDHQAAWEEHALITRTALSRTLRTTQGSVGLKNQYDMPVSSTSPLLTGWLSVMTY